MRKRKSSFKKIITFVLSAAIVLASMMNVFAASNSIRLGYNGNKVKAYIAGVDFYYKITSDGQYLYCLEKNKNLARDVKANLVKNSSRADGGLAYIMKNGYPNKSITGNKEKDYYITQTAVWWYLDKMHGTSNLSKEFKSTGSDSYGLRKYVKQLMTEGYNHRNDSNIDDLKLAFSADTTGMTLEGNYYVSGNIKVSSGSGTYKIAIAGPEGTKIIRSNGVENSGEVNVNVGEVFKIKVPASALSSTSLTIKATAVGAQGYQYTAYEYQPTDSAMQPVALLEKSVKQGSVSINLTIDSSRVSITKVDYNTKEAIAGAKLVLKNSNGTVISEWTSTINAHIIRNLANGNYTIEETEAPTGYLLNKNITKFTIDNNNRDVKITIENAPKKVVVNIIKVDQETNQALPGAVLVVKDSTGKEIARFTTTDTAYVLTDLENGTYTVEEISAPEGYLASSDKISFTIDDEHLSHQVKFVNAKATVVPDTASMSSIIMVILGLLIMSSGIYYVYTNARKA